MRAPSLRKNLVSLVIICFSEMDEEHVLWAHLMKVHFLGKKTPTKAIHKRRIIDSSDESGNEGSMKKLKTNARELKHVKFQDEHV